MARINVQLAFPEQYGLLKGDLHDFIVENYGDAVALYRDRKHSDERLWYLNSAGYAQEYDPDRPPSRLPVLGRLIITPVETLIKLLEEDRTQPSDRTIADFTDKELADMVRNSIYVRNAKFGEGPMTSRFMLVLAVTYGDDEHVQDLDEALEGLHRLMADDDWKERDIQIYDHQASQRFFSATLEEIEANTEGNEDEDEEEDEEEQL